MGWKEVLYERSPVFFQNIGVSWFGYRWKKRRFGGNFDALLKGYKDRERYTAQQWKDYQTAELRNLLQHAYATVPYYHSTFNASGLTPSRLAAFELSDMASIPFLTKETMRRLGTTDLVSSVKSPGAQFFSSSGSTGTPIRLLFSNETERKWQAAYEARVRNWAGVSRFDSRAMIGGRRVVTNNKPPFYRYNSAEKQIYFSIYHNSKVNASEYYAAFLKHRPDYFVGYSASLATLASYFLELGLKPFPLKAVLGSSEKLTAPMRRNLSDFFQCKVFDAWSGIESCGLVSEREDGKMYLSPDVGIVEFLDENGKPVQPGTPGEMVCTGFLNYDQPLIRYRIGDIGTIATAEGSSPIGMPRILEIAGRTDDLILLADGRQLASFNRFFADLEGIREVQVIQKDFHLFQLNIAADSSFGSHTQEAIRKSFEERIGPSDIEFNLVDNVPRDRNGKFKAVISLLRE